MLRRAFAEKPKHGSHDGRDLGLLLRFRLLDRILADPAVFLVPQSCRGVAKLWFRSSLDVAKYFAHVFKRFAWHKKKRPWSAMFTNINNQGIFPYLLFRGT